MLFRLIYCSTMSNPSLNVEVMVSASQRKNPSLGITGGLAVIDGAFLQYLEGEQDKVESLFSSILQDSRHFNVLVLERRAILRRTFPDWAMARLHWSDETRDIFYSFSPGARRNIYNIDPTTAAPTFRAWAQTTQWRR